MACSLVCTVPVPLVAQSRYCAYVLVSDCKVILMDSANSESVAVGAGDVLLGTSVPGNTSKAQSMSF
jgi:hypothetical protein